MILYLESADGIVPAQLAGFFVDWPDPPSPETHLRLLAASDLVVLALDDATEVADASAFARVATGAVVGFVTAVTDGVLSAYIPLLEVLPAYHGRGVGTALMGRMLARLSHLYMVDLLCDAEVGPFYARLGMEPAAGMTLRRYARQSGASTPPS